MFVAKSLALPTFHTALTPTRNCRLVFPLQVQAAPAAALAKKTIQ